MKKWLILSYILLVLVGFINKEIVVNWIQTSDTRQIPYMIGLSTLFSIFPIVPFTLFASMMGVKYGVVLGAIINWVGSVIAAFIMFVGIRYFFREQGKVYLTRYKIIKRFHELVEKNSFMAVLFGRILPIIPPPIINVYSAISNMPATTFMGATVLGKIPGMIVYAYIGDKLFTSFYQLVKGLSIYVVFLVLIFMIYKIWLKSSKFKLSKNVKPH